MKKFIKNIPFIGYIIRLAKTLVRLPRIIHNIEGSIHHVHTANLALQEKTTSTNLRLIELIEEFQANNTSLEQYATVISELRHNMSQLPTASSHRKSVKADSMGRQHTFADDHELDDFYLKFENKFRGTEDVIIERLQVYLPYFKDFDKTLKKLPVLDIGCGRGEFLELLKSESIKVRGLDINEEMVKRARNKGFDVEEGDALTYLSKQQTNTFSAICGFHIVEHIPFSELMKIFNECFRTIKSGGIAIFETPNPENITVGALNFNYDPSHLKPLPPQLLAYCMEYIGFTDVEILPLHPELDTTNEDPMLNATFARLFGPRDYAVICKRP